MWGYIFSAICPKKGKGAGLVLLYCDTEAMQEQLPKSATPSILEHMSCSFSIKPDGTLRRS